MYHKRSNVITLYKINVHIEVRHAGLKGDVKETCVNRCACMCTFVHMQSEM